MPVTIGVCLEEDGTRGVFEGVSCDGEGGGKVWEVENWFQQEEGFEGVKGGLAGRRPVPREVFLGEVNERSGDIGVVWNELSVEIGKAKEGSDIFNLFGGWPTSNPIQLDGVHGKLSGFDDHS